MVSPSTKRSDVQNSKFAARTLDLVDPFNGEF